MERDRSNNERLTKDQYVEKARAIWGDAYDYTDSEYLAGLKPIIIRCKKHNIEFCVMAGNHIANHKPAGCPVCAAEREAERRMKESVAAAYKRAASNLEKGRKDIQREKKRREYGSFYYTNESQAEKNARFIEKVVAKYGDRYDFSKLKYIHRDTCVTLICPDHGEFQITPRTLLNGTKGTPPHGCWKCCGLQDPADKFVLTAKGFNQRVQKLYMLKGLAFPLKRKIKPTDKITAVCRKHGEITHDAMWWYHGNGCEYCNGKWYAPHWKDYARRVHGDKYEYVGDAPVKQTDYIHYICPTHGLQEQKYSIHVGLGCGCPECANYPNKKSPLERCNEWIAKCIEKYGEGRYDYSRAHEDYVNNDSLVWIRCCLHNHWFKTTPDNNLRTVNGSCPICSAEFTETQGEAEIHRWLLKHGITNFKQDEVTLPNENPKCKRQYLRPDFWLPDYNLFIEYNGEQHYEDVDYFFNDNFTFEDQQIRDQTLRDYCQRHGHRLLEIPYWDFQRIGEILTDELLNR